EGLLGIKILASSEVWNINKPVVINAVDTKGKVFKFGTDRSMHFINSVKKDSLLYDVLMNDLHLTRKNISLILNENSLSDGYDTGYQRPYIKNKTTMVPAAFISEQFDAEVLWDAKKQQVTIADDFTGNYLVFTIGSKEALVNGYEHILNHPAEIYYGRSFVPLAFIAKHLGAEVHWDGATKSVTITRD
ncbi:MAG TPA: copper amine oxidase N-terminal domain-containing protein, partial [Bacilli bacterium]